MRRADHSSRGVLPSVVCRGMWSRNLAKEWALAHWEAVESKTNKIHIIGKAIPLQAWTGPEGSRSLRLPNFKIIGTWRLSALRTGRLSPPPLEMLLVLISVRDRGNPRAIVRPGNIMSMKNSNDTIGNRIRDLPTCSAVLHCDCTAPTLLWQEFFLHPASQMELWFAVMWPERGTSELSPYNVKI